MTHTFASAAVFAVAGLLSQAAAAHSASDAYLTMDIDPTAAQATGAVIHLQWDIALRDLDFVLKLDDNGDGSITWGELRQHQAAIAAYAQAHIKILGDGRPCSMGVTKQWVDNHADGAYAALFLDARCLGVPHPPKTLSLDYRLFFDIDPSHRAIVIAHVGTQTATALLAPQNAKIDLRMSPSR